METLTYQFSLTTIRLIYKKCNALSIEFKDFLIFANNETEANIILMLQSITDGLCTFEDFKEDSYINDCTGYYSTEHYVLSLERDIINYDHANLCDYFDKYTIAELSRCYIGNNDYYYCESAIERLNLKYYNGDYYDNEGLNYHNLVTLNNGDISHIDDCYYWESDNDYHSEDEDTQDNYVRDYHDGSSKILKFTKNPKFFIGFEIEKEDFEIKKSVDIYDFENRTNGYWRKEKDGSLDDNSGFELISPTFELNTKKIFNHINENKILISHINAEKSLNCGGHINISQKGLTGLQLFDNIKGYTPFFYALYYKRINKTHSKGKSNNELKDNNEKYQSVKIHNNRVEYRIISAVDNVETLLWRTKLMNLILRHQTDCPQKAFFNFKTIFSNLIAEQYKGEKLINLEKRLIKFSLQFEAVHIKIND